jgi:hypothetical protein
MWISLAVGGETGKKYAGSHVGRNNIFADDT